MEIIFSNTQFSPQNPITGRGFHPSILPKCLFLLIFLLPLTSAGPALYPTHCGEILRAPPLISNPNNPPILDRRFLVLRHAHVNYTSNATNNKRESSSSVVANSVSLFSTKAYKTLNDAVFKLEVALTLDDVMGHPRRGLRMVHFRSPRIPMTSGGPWNHALKFSLTGFWDSASGKLCMVGSGLGKFTSDHVVLKLDYSNSSSIFNSLVNGTLESVDIGGGSSGDLNLGLVSILGVNLRGYKYELIGTEAESKGFMLLDDMGNVSLGVGDLGQKVCTYVRSAGAVELEYKSDCNSVNCNFLGGNGNYTPSLMYFNEIDCLEDARVRFLLGFGDWGHNGYQMPFEPNMTLVSEGKWDSQKRRLNMVGCRIFTDSDDFVGECLIRLSLRFPARWTLRERSSIVGELWSSRSANESGYFGQVSFRSAKNKNVRAPGLRYEYTEIEKARKLCENKSIQKGEGKYPRASSSDMRFDMVVENKKVKDLWGYSSPLYVDKRLYRLPTVFLRENESTLKGKQNLSNAVNISYVMSVSASHDFKLNSELTQIISFDISAEGTYNSTNGHLCMIGCMHVASTKGGVKRNSSLDCEIKINIQYPPLRLRTGGVVKGTIESTRKKSDRLYFEPLEIVSRSIYAGQAKESIWRMDLEITMVLISNTLLCVFIGMQLLHVKRHSDALPQISIVMLGVLTLAHMVPLLLNFEALFMVGRNNVYFGGDGWLEVNEVLVRVITMLAFLLEFRLLQMAWSSRSNESTKNSWVFDKKVIFLSLPMYIFGGLMSWLVHRSRTPHQRPWLRNGRFGYKKQSMWGDLKSYAGLILDGFLFPQILFNLFSDSKEKTLAPSFYFGTTFVRLLPHAYDLYRSHSATWSFGYIYANPRMDFYSTTWDIVISAGGLVFACVIYLQQRFGGRCLLPKRFMQRSSYEKVPVASSTE